MRVVVCIKQVPVLSAMQFDANSKTLKREGVPTEVSAFDLRAVSKAVELVRAHGGEVVVLTMGPPSAREALEECLALGADRAVHLSDRAFAGSDTLATARTLAAAIVREPFDLVLCGLYSIDAETGQVGPELAELLGVAQISGVRALSIDSASGRVRAERETDRGIDVVEAALPLLITAAEDLAPERFASKIEREQAKQKPIATLSAADLTIASEQLGQKGSPTSVAGLETIVSNRSGHVLSTDSIDVAVDELVAALLERGLFGEWKSTATGVRAAGPPIARRGANDVWVVAEQLGRELRPVTFELLGKGAELVQRLGSSLDVVLIGSDLARHVDALARYQAQRILLADGPQLVAYDTDLYAAILADAIRVRQPGIVLVPSTAIGRDLAPRVAARLGLGLTGDCIDLDLDADGRLLQYKPAFGGSVVAPILSSTRPEMATIRPGLLTSRATDSPCAPTMVSLAIPNLGPARVAVVSQQAAAATAAALDHADVVIGVGKGLGGADRLAAIQPLLDVLDGALCTTRDVTDEGWLPKQYQVGLTGRAIAPQLYIAIAIRGAMEHMVGVRRAGLIVAINKNPKAPIFKQADFGIVGDYVQIVPPLVERLQRARTNR